MQDVLKVEVRNGVATLTLDQPAERNPLSTAMKDALIVALESCATDASLGAVVITGNGSAFCAGGDLKRAAGATPTIEERAASLAQLQRIPELIASLPQVVIAAVNGSAMGAGLGLACMCDLRIASNAARFGAAFLRIGLSTDFGVAWTLPRIVGPARARRLLLLGETLTASQALEIGLLTQMTEPLELMAAARGLAERFANGPHTAVAALKRNLSAADTMQLPEYLQLEAANQMIALQSDDHRKALQAFLQSRKTSA